MTAKHKTAPKNRKYAFRSGARIPKSVDAQEVGLALADIHRRDGALKTARVLEHAEPTESPLHGMFEWRDKVAGHQYRLWQARELIRSIEIVVVERDGNRPQEQMPIYVHVPQSAGHSHYGDIDDVIERPEQFSAAMAAAMAKRDQMERFIEHLKRRVESSPTYAEKSAALQIALESLAACKLALERAA